jgi:signal transduction histidine kinase
MLGDHFARLSSSIRARLRIEARHAFDPFFSGRQAGRGLGFGLCKCFRIAEMHHAMLEIASNPNGPTTVRLIWPANSASAIAGDG